MKQVQKRTGREILTNIFGVLGYLSIATAGALTICLAMALGYQLLGGDMTSVTMQEAVSGGQSGAEAAPWVRYVGYFIAAIFIILSVVILIILPYKISKFGRKLTAKIAALFRLPLNNIWSYYAAKVVLCVALFTLAAVLAQIIKLDDILVIFIAIASLTFAAVVLFSFQMVLAALFKLDYAKIL